jgi:two-component system chemotaxis response regulator CheB
MSSIISILVVDDSAFMRKMIAEMISEDPGLCVVGQARDGEDALRKLALLRPDVITLDVEMPVMDGLAALDQIMQRRPTPTIMLSSLTHAGTETTMRCLERGAVDFVGKPSGSISLNIRAVAGELIAKIKAAAGVRMSRLSPALGARGPKAASPAVHAPAAGKESAGRAKSASSPGVLVIGASTGGPRALQTLLPALPTPVPMPIVIVQHMPPGFTKSFAGRLNSELSFAVREAADGDMLETGLALVAPGGRHLQFEGHGIARLSDEPPVHGVRPSVDVTLASLAQIFGPRIVAVLLTGMGRDGARGLKTIYEMGGATLVEDESTCVVYGMPKAAVELRAVQQELPLPEIAGALGKLWQNG